MATTFANTTLFIDTETHSADLLYDREPEDFVRITQYAWGEGPVEIFEGDVGRTRNLIRSATRVVGHNVNYDLTAVFGKDSTEPLEMAMDGRILDTFIYASLVNPAPYMYTNRFGRTIYDAAKPERAMSYLSLAEQCHQLGIEGKHGDLKELAKKYNPPKTLVADLDYGLIPTDDPDFVAYAIQDVIAVRELARTLFDRFGRPNDYAWREMKVAGINAQISRNGFTVDREAAERRVEELRVRREVILAELAEKYGLPTEGKSPWATLEGKDAIFKALLDYGIAPEVRSDWPKTATGNPSLSGEALLAMTAGTEAEELGQALAELKGQRSLAQLALDSMHHDGKAHPEITTLQRSGRTSVTKPGLTVWTARGDKAVDKAMFIASPGRKLVEFDFQAADARAVAALSGDIEYKKRFDPGVDSHELTGRLVFGDDMYDSDPKHYRQVAKLLSHAYAYRAGPKKLATSSGQPLEVAQQFVNAMKEAYPLVLRWQDRTTREGESGWVTNDWGRRMRVDPDRSYNQSPALHGQSTTRELLYDALFRMHKRDPRIIEWVVALIHDSIVIDCPEEELDWVVPAVVEAMEITFSPLGGQPVVFEAGHGEPADNWYLSAH